ncbi:fatty acid desaturase [Corallococcus sp. M34]|uniref:fatty acid desaturase family protein n=1 Tax=Citreicoccus inhibens TaxID=2849499 RepID=UPI001C23F8C9|nr:fatty acid desaturase [Citreicoccus inhibens]MBU8895930.1 fatty acid desaturase [Citreicoccus inhibens]
MPRVRSTPPRFDVPQLTAHALWWLWFLAFTGGWARLSSSARGGLWLVGVALVFWNYAVLHNHMHVAIARPRAVRWLVSRTLGLACGFPYRGYVIHHLNHHRFSDGPGDWGQRRRGEGAFGYCVRSVFAPWLWPFALMKAVWRSAARHGQRAELLLDFAVVDGTLLGLIIWRPTLGLSFWALLLTGQICIHWLNLAAHFGTDPTCRDALAVTSTSRLYNHVFFNAGYHQAHHVRPHVPWFELPSFTRELASRGQVRPGLVSPFAPIHPRWVARVAKQYSARLCDARTDSTTTSEAPSVDIS